ncbi:hypothetical protein MJH12_05570, partial [bacterium]|nr:hypothetical protein [bacterium]
SYEYIIGDNKDSVSIISHYDLRPCLKENDHYHRKVNILAYFVTSALFGLFNQKDRKLPLILQANKLKQEIEVIGDSSYNFNTEHFSISEKGIEFQSTLEATEQGFLFRLSCQIEDCVLSAAEANHIYKKLHEVDISEFTCFALLAKELGFWENFKYECRSAFNKDKTPTWQWLLLLIFVSKLITLYLESVI